MAILIAILCLVGAIAGAELPAVNAVPKKSAVQETRTARPTVPPSVPSIPVCNAATPGYRNLNLPVGAQAPGVRLCR